MYLVNYYYSQNKTCNKLAVHMAVSDWNCDFMTMALRHNTR